MKLCQNCGQLLAEDITACPSCGGEVAEGIKTIDDYRIIEVLHEGYATILCRAVKAQTEESVMIRIFSPQSGVDQKIAERLNKRTGRAQETSRRLFCQAFRDSAIFRRAVVPGQRMVGYPKLGQSDCFGLLAGLPHRVPALLPDGFYPGRTAPYRSLYPPSDPGRHSGHQR